MQILIPLMSPHPTCRDHNLTNLTILEDASTHIWVLTRSFWKIFSIFSCGKLIFHCSPTLPPGTMIWTNFNPHYLRILPHKLSFSGHIVFEKEIFINYRGHIFFKALNNLTYKNAGANFFLVKISSMILPPSHFKNPMLRAFKSTMQYTITLNTHEI